MEDELDEDEKLELEELESEARERQLEAAEQASYGYPEEIEKPSAFQFFNKVLSVEDSSKVGNLRNEELGGTRLSVRDYLTLANFQRSLGHKRVAEYFERKAEISTKTSLSRDGFLMNLAVTQRKESRKSKLKEGKKGWLK